MKTPPTKKKVPPVSGINPLMCCGTFPALAYVGIRLRFECQVVSAHVGAWAETEAQAAKSFAAKTGEWRRAAMPARKKSKKKAKPIGKFHDIADASMRCRIHNQAPLIEEYPSSKEWRVYCGTCGKSSKQIQTSRAKALAFWNASQTPGETGICPECKGATVLANSTSCPTCKGWAMLPINLENLRQWASNGLSEKGRIRDYGVRLTMAVKEIDRLNALLSK